MKKIGANELRKLIEKQLSEQFFRKYFNDRGARDLAFNQPKRVALDDYSEEESIVRRDIERDSLEKTGRDLGLNKKLSTVYDSSVSAATLMDKKNKEDILSTIVSDQRFLEKLADALDEYLFEDE